MTPPATSHEPPRGTAPTSTLADVAPALLAALGVAGCTDRLGLYPSRAVCLLLVDGLGWQALQEHSADAPFLAALSDCREPLTAGFPATTATSLASLSTGQLAGRHGIVGYTFTTPDGSLINTLRWRTYGQDDGVDLREKFAPEDAQPLPTAWERAADDGVRVTLAVPHQFEGSGLTRAVLRGGELRGVHALGDLTSTALAALSGGDGERGDGERALCYAYHADLDLLGHVYGPGSLPWRLHLAHIDQLVTALGDGLPEGSQLVVTSDHGMVPAPGPNRLDYDTEPVLQAGVRLLGGDPRARYVYTEPGATEDVLATWGELIGDRAWILTRDEAIEHGWFGPVVDDLARSRIGDLVVASRTDLTIVRSTHHPRSARLLGHHGSLTPAEQLVPLAVFNPDAD